MQKETIKFSEQRLENGLQVIVHEDNRTPLVHVTLHYKVGSSYEQPGHSGFAHLFEHLMFQGSANVEKNQHGLHIDRAGGTWNATTSKDRTNYYETAPSNYLDLCLWLEADRMHSLEVSEENFENQRKTVIEEKKQSYDNKPYGKAFLKFDELAYSNWAYAHPIIGSRKDLEEARLEDVRAFHEKFYGPGNACLVVSGDVEEATAFSRVEHFFGSIPNKTSAQVPRIEEPEQDQEQTLRLKDPLAVLPAVSIGYHIPPIGSPEYYSLSILALILSGGESSRFYRRLVYENNWITNLSTGPNQYRGPELYTIWFQVQDGIQPQRVVEAIEEELVQIQEGPSEAELQKARNQIFYRFVSRKATVSGIGEGLARYALFFDDANLVNTELARFAAVGSEEVGQAARKFLRPKNRSLLIVEPEK